MNTKTVSPREEVQEKLVDYLATTKGWDAPYGIIAGLKDLDRGGKVRLVTFGVARYLDAVAYIWSPSRIEVKAAGPLAYKVEGTFGSLEETIRALSGAVPAPEPTIADAFAGASAMRARGVAQDTGLDCHQSNYGDEASPYEREHGIGAQDGSHIGWTVVTAGERWAEALRRGSPA